VVEGSATSKAGVLAGDQLVALNGEDTSSLSEDVLQAQLQASGRATFRRELGEGQQQSMFVCSRCKSCNSISVERSPEFFNCHGCKTTALSLACLSQERPVRKPPLGNRCCRRARKQPLRLKLQDISWEESGLQSLSKHPTGFGRFLEETPGDCRHHRQTGATCGVAAVNNVLTNCDMQGVTAEQMMVLSASLGQAESAIREGAESVEEAGAQHNVSELYATSEGGHFDLQTLQYAFHEFGHFRMWYVPKEMLVDTPHKLFSQADLAGYVCHRRDPVDPKRDHWFVLRKHCKGKSEMYLLQDSLYDSIFSLTQVEAVQLCQLLGPGGVFAVSRGLAEPAAAEPEATVLGSSSTAPPTGGSAEKGVRPELH